MDETQMILLCTDKKDKEFDSFTCLLFPLGSFREEKCLKEQVHLVISQICRIADTIARINDGKERYA